MRCTLPLLMSALLLASCGSDDDDNVAESAVTDGGPTVVTGTSAFTIESWELESTEDITPEQFRSSLRSASSDFENVQDGEAFTTTTHITGTVALPEGGTRECDVAIRKTFVVESIDASRVNLSEQQSLSAQGDEACVSALSSAAAAPTQLEYPAVEKFISWIQTQGENYEFKRGSRAGKTYYQVDMEINEDELKGQRTMLIDPSVSGIYSVVFKRFNGTRSGRPYTEEVQTLQDDEAARTGGTGANAGGDAGNAGGEGTGTDTGTDNGGANTDVDAGTGTPSTGAGTDTTMPDTGANGGNGNNGNTAPSAAGPGARPNLGTTGRP